MARKRKTPSSPPSQPERTRDAEALALFLFAAALFLGVTLYSPPGFTGQYGEWLRLLLWPVFGLPSLALPPLVATAGIFFLTGHSFRPYLRGLLLGSLAALVILPLLAYLRPDLGGSLGQGVLTRLLGGLGLVGLLVPLALLTLLADLGLRRRPGFLVASGLRRVSLASGRLANTAQLGHTASRLLGQARTLHRLYPDHRALEALVEELRQFRPVAQQLPTLEGYGQQLDQFVAERSRDLAEQVRLEPRPLQPQLERLAQSLQLPLKAAGVLVRALEERRGALLLEVQLLRNKTAHLTRTAEESSAWLARGIALAALENARNDHLRRQQEWQKVHDLLPDLTARIDGWLGWLEWLEHNPAAGQTWGLEQLQQYGLLHRPPAWVPPAEPEPVAVVPPPPLPPVAAVPEGSFSIDLEFPTVQSMAQVPVAAAPVPVAVPSPAAANPPVVRPSPVAAAVAVATAVATHPANGTALSLPGLDLLDPPEAPKHDPQLLEAATRQLASTIDEALKSFAVEARVVGWARGPTVTRFELEPAPGEKISRVANLSNDLARALAAGSVRIEAPIPGKSVIGLEVPNTTRQLVRYSEAVAHPNFQRSRERLPLVLGKSIEGEVWVRDLSKMPHLLIAGSTGSGKSVAINTLITSLLYKFLPTELRLLMIDPKMVELTPYEGIPHLIRPVVTNPADAAGVLLGAVGHMERRYKMLSQVGARNLEQFNEKQRLAGAEPLPFMIIVIDELADLMITAPKEVEQAILRLAQMARATGMHLVLATQRPSVDILTSLIKVNVPARMAFAVSSGFDSRTILDTQGAERLVGQGDMLFHQPGLPKPVRLQGPFLSENEVHRLAEFLRQQSFDDTFAQQFGSDFEAPTPGNSEGGPGTSPIDFNDPLLKKAAEIVIEEGEGSVSRLQRRLSVGHARAGKLIDGLEAMGIVGPHRGSKSREVLVTRDQLGEFFGYDAR